MKKSDLKTGMRVTQANGTKLIVMLNTIVGEDVIVCSEEGSHAWDKLSSYTDNLLIENRKHAQLDIIKVEVPDSKKVLYDAFYEYSGWKVIWERKPELPKINELPLGTKLVTESGREYVITQDPDGSEKIAVFFFALEGSLEWRAISLFSYTSTNPYYRVVSVYSKLGCYSSAWKE